MPKIGRMGRREQRERRKKVLEVERQIRETCMGLAAIMNQPIKENPDEVRKLYARLGDLQRGLDKLVGDVKSDETVSAIYNEIVKSS